MLKARPDKIVKETNRIIFIQNMKLGFTIDKTEQIMDFGLNGIEQNSRKARCMFLKCQLI